LAKALTVRLETPSVGAIEAYRDVIADLLSRFRNPDFRCLLVIDGVDETITAGWQLGQALLPAHPPEGLRVFVSARPLAGDSGPDGWRNRLGWAGSASVQEFELGGLPFDAVEEMVEAIVAGATTQLSHGDRLRLVKQLYRLSEEGDPLLVELNAVDVREALDGGLGAVYARLSGRKPGLRGYFESWMEERSASAQAGTTQPGQISEATLVLLAAALGPVEHADLVALLRRVLPDETVPAKSDLLAPLARFVIGDGMNTGYTLGHPRFNAYLAEEQYAGTPLLEACRSAFLNWGKSEMDLLVAHQKRTQQIPNYVVEWYPWHVIQHAKEGESELLRFLRIEWVEACRHFTGDATFAILAQAVLDRLLSVLDRQSAPDETLLAGAIRAALFLSSIRQSCNSAGVELLVLAFEHSVLDEEAVIDRQKLFAPRERVRFLLTLMEAKGLQADRFSLWRAARDVACQIDDEAERQSATNEVLRAFRIGFHANQIKESALWDEALLALQEQLAAPAERLTRDSFVDLFPFAGPWERVLVEQGIPESVLVRLMRILLADVEDPGLLSVFMGALVDTAREKASPPPMEEQAWEGQGQTPVSSSEVQAFLERLLPSEQDDGQRVGCCVRAIRSFLKSSLEEVSEPCEALEQFAPSGADARHRSAVIGALLGVSSAKPPNSCLAFELFRSLQAEGVVSFVVAVVGKVRRLADKHLGARLVQEAWSAVSTVPEKETRLPLRTMLLPMLETDASIFPEILKECEIQPSDLGLTTDYLARLLAVANQRLSLGQRRDIASVLVKSRVSYLVSALGAGLTSEQRKAFEQEFLTTPPVGSDPDSQLRERVIAIVCERTPETDASRFNRGLELARKVGRPRIRSSLFTQLVSIAPEEQKVALISEALQDAGAIGDCASASQTIINLARDLPLPARESEASDALKLLDGAEPVEVIDAVCNCRWALSPSTARIWADRAREALSHVDGAASPHATARFVASFPEDAPFSMLKDNLGVVLAANDVEVFERVLPFFLTMQGWRGRYVCWTVWRNRNRMAASVQTVINWRLAWKHPVIFRSALKPALAGATRLEDPAKHLELLADLAPTLPGKLREAIVDQALRVIEKATAECRVPVWISDYNSLGRLYDGAGRASKERIAGVVNECQNQEMRLQLELCLFPMLPPAERAKSGPILLSRTGSHPFPGIGNVANYRCTGASLLFRYWQGANRRAPLLLFLRNAAEADRWTLWFEIPHIVSALPEATRVAVVGLTLQTIKDALRLWP
jgi:hypothetical protein